MTERPAMQAFEIDDVLDERSALDKPYLEFLRVDTMSAGMYVLGAGDVDLQSPHDEDEIYFVRRGRGSITVDGETRAVQSGSIVFVAAKAEHRFHDIEEDLELLVFFAPPET